MSFHLAFKGGTDKRDDATFKFFCFFRIEEGREVSEVMLYRAEKRGIITRAAELDLQEDELVGVPHYSALVPDVKIFASSAGFGVQKRYYSYFIRLDATSPKIITIRPFGLKYGQAFRARGRFLTPAEVKEMYGEDSETYQFYTRQTYLSKYELQDYVTIENVGVPVPQDVRRIRC